MGISVFKLLLILVIVLVIFGAGKLPQVMGDVGKGIRSLKDGLHGDDATKPAPPLQEVTQNVPPPRSDTSSPL